MAFKTLENGIGFKAVDYTDTPISSATTETDMFSCIIPGDRMGSYKKLLFRINCTITTSIATPTITFRIKYGGQILTLATGLTLLGSVTNKPFIIEGTISNQGVMDVQYVYARITGSSAISLSLGSMIMEGADWAINSANNQTLSATVQYGLVNITGATITRKTVEIQII